MFDPEICRNEKEVETKFIASYLLPRLDYQASDWVQQPAFNRLRLDFLAHQLVIEAKKPSQHLDNDHVKQLTRYLQETKARYGLLTNAKELRIYEQINADIRLVFRCFVKGIENNMFDLKKLIGKRVLSQNKAQDKTQDNVQHNPVEIIQQVEPEIINYSSQESSNMKIIGVYHNKGGVGKTTVSVNLAAALRNMGKRVLLIDIDAQANATFATGLIKFLFDEDDDLVDRNVFNLLEEAENGFIPDIRHSSVNFNAPEIDVIASHITLIDKQSRITAFLHTRFRLHKKLQLVKDQYDIVIIDAPPSRDIYAEITLITADYLIIPSDLKPFANQGLPNVRHFIRQIDETRMSIGKGALQIIGVLPSKISSNAQYLRHTFQKQRQHIVDKYHFPVMESRIIDRKSLSDCFNQDIENGELRIPDPKSIFMFGGSIESCEEFNMLAKEVLLKIGV
ncbi:chromosome partitioning protein ParA [Thioflexithrix psekupsensis]|uniref:Chromosome partitioning protein ParA n=1 Tax=Thioflexithrix psekupsensis TaxID=1570016 RepID=A0A251XAF7_9GAMM|nr:chromosome partitioning protein ParA [Thioflexithrix psekupsensis]